MQRLDRQAYAPGARVRPELGQGVGDPLPRPGQVPAALGQSAETSTSVSVPRTAASSIAARLSSSARTRAWGSSVVKKPPRHSVVTLSPASRTSRAAASTPYARTGSRHRPTPGTPDSVQASHSWGSESCLTVIWLMLRRERSSGGWGLMR